MPVHDWTRVDDGLFHHFHQTWTASLCNALNGGVLPDGYLALVEQNVNGSIPDVLALKIAPGVDVDESETAGGGVAVSKAAPKTRLVRRCEETVYSDKANLVVVRHRHGEVVSVIEVVSPGNKSSRAAFRAFVEKSVGLLRQHIHLMVIDLFPPTKRDPQGVHRALWEEFGEEDDEVPAATPLTLASYDAGPPQVAYVENIAVGDALPEMPLFFRPEYYVRAPLEATYQATWETFPKPLKKLLT